MQITISSLNLQGFESWEARQNTISEYFNKVKPAIICLQEVVYLPELSAFTPAHLINQQLGYPSSSIDVTRLQVGLDYPVYREGLATLSRYEIVKSETIILEQAKGDHLNRIIQLLDIKIANGTIVKLANVHFSITDITDFATPHLHETLNLLKSRGEKRIIIGDFNLDGIEDAKELWGDNYHSTSGTAYVSFPSQNRRIDYALVPKEYTIDSIQTSPDGLSDHRAITVTITIPETISQILSHESLELHLS